jgi:hypothetical protein
MGDGQSLDAVKRRGAADRRTAPGATGSNRLTYAPASAIIIRHYQA